MTAVEARNRRKATVKIRKKENLKKKFIQGREIPSRKATVKMQKK